MTRADQESTAPIHRDALLGLLELTRADRPVANRPRTKRKRAPTFSQIAALLPPCEPRFPRATRPPPLAFANTPAAAQQRAAQLVADVRARLDSADDAAALRAASAERASLPVLSLQVAAQLSAEEIAMLPMEMRLTLPEVPSWDAPPRIEMAPLPRLDPNQLRLLATIIACAAATFLAGLCAGYFLV